VEPRTYVFGSFEFAPVQRRLLLSGKPVALGSRALDILTVLIESAGTIVPARQIIARVWPGTHVEDGSLRVHISALRRVLGDGSDGRIFITNVPGQGYNFVAPIQTARGAPDAPATLTISTARGPPRSLAYIVGRGDTIATLRAQLSRRRMLTITGPGGIGKTTVATAVAESAGAAYHDGVWFVPLASLADPTLVAGAVAATLGVIASSADPLSAVITRLRDRRALIVLDNCEHVIEGAAAVAESLLRAIPGLSILATSREVLRVEGEFLHRLPPLTFPPVSTLITADVADAYSAVRLFLDRVNASVGEIPLTTLDLQAIGEICRRLDGLPLALELAAVQVEVFGTRGLAHHLNDRFAFLTKGRRTAMPRHRTLRATLDWSYQLLSEPERAMLNRMAIFAGPFSLDGARAVATEDIEESDVIIGLSGLVKKSMVAASAEGARTEFRLLDTTRAYAADRLRESGAHADVARRHARYLLGLLSTVGTVRGAHPAEDHQAALVRLADEVHVALEWAFGVSGDSAIGLELTIAAIPLWFELFQMTVARDRLEQALPHAKADSEPEMRIRVGLGNALWYIAPTSDAFEPNFVRVAEIANRLRTPRAEAQALWGMWAARRRRGDYTAALEAAQRYADAAERADDRGATHLANRILGLTHHLLGHQSDARAFTERALSRPDDLDPTSGMGYQVETPVAMKAQMARVLWLTGSPDLATQAAEEAVATALSLGHSFPVAFAIAFAGLPVALWTGDHDAARRHLDLLRVRAGGDDRMELWALYFDRILASRAEGETEALIAARADCVVIPPFGDHPPDTNVPEPGPEPGQAIWNTPEVLRIDAELALWRDLPGAAAVAETKLLRSLAIAREQTARSWELRGAMSLARLWRRQRQFADARDVLASTYRTFTEGFDTGDLRAARVLLDALPR
jgi:predicted ATPase/DNA-binding winged helix-turn-helix (wHTH) protein